MFGYIGVNYFNYKSNLNANICITLSLLSNNSVT